MQNLKACAITAAGNTWDVESKSKLSCYLCVRMRALCFSGCGARPCMPSESQSPCQMPSLICSPQGLTVGLDWLTIRPPGSSHSCLAFLHGGDRPAPSCLAFLERVQSAPYFCSASVLPTKPFIPLAVELVFIILNMEIVSRLRKILLKAYFGPFETLPLLKEVVLSGCLGFVHHAGM